MIQVVPEGQNAFLNYLFGYEYRLLKIPAPDVVIDLQVASAIRQKQMTGR